MSDYIIVRTKGLYKIYRVMADGSGVYQYSGATFVMLKDAQDFIQIRNGEYDAT